MTPISRTSSVSEIYMFVPKPTAWRACRSTATMSKSSTPRSKAAARARAGEGPTFIEGITYRLAGHMAGDLETYRSTEEIDMQRQHEPLTQLRSAC
jgi:hypothetical protein